MKNTFIVGSNAFFKDFPDFTPSDTDTVILVDNPTEFNIDRQIRIKKPTPQCIFEWRRMSVEEFINVSLRSKCGMIVGKFLVPEFAHEIGMTIEHLKELQPLIDILDEKHSYEKKIYNYYIENDKFELTDEQLSDCYEEYKKYK